MACPSFVLVTDPVGSGIGGAVGCSGDAVPVSVQGVSVAVAVADSSSQVV